MNGKSLALSFISILVPLSMAYQVQPVGDQVQPVGDQVQPVGESLIINGGF